MSDPDADLGPITDAELRDYVETGFCCVDRVKDLAAELLKLRGALYPGPFTITVDGEQVMFEGLTITYRDVVRLAYGDVSPDTVFSVVYRNGHPARREGMLTPNGGAVPVVFGMSFGCATTGNA